MYRGEEPCESHQRGPFRPVGLEARTEPEKDGNVGSLVAEDVRNLIFWKALAKR